VALAGCREVFGIDRPVLAGPGDAFDTIDVGGDGIGTDAAAYDGMPGACASDAGAVQQTVVLTANGTQTQLTISAISLAGSQTPTVTAGSSVALMFHYDFQDTACSGNCIDQIEIGFVPGSRIGCVFDGSVPKATGAQGTISTNVTMPTTPGQYDFRVNIGENYSCTYNAATNWWGATPPPAATIARVCVN
jgi:hypothetical protein